MWMFVPMHAVALTLLLWRGDPFDLLGYTAVVVLIHGAYAARGTRRGRPAEWALWLAIHLVILESLNRVWGYPNGDLWPLAAIGAWAIAIGLAIGAFVLPRGGPAAVALAVLIYPPLVRGPIVGARQLALDRRVPDHGWIAATHVGPKRIVGVKATSYGCDAVVLAPGGEGWFETTSAPLLDGSGSMEAQRPNLPHFVDLTVCR